MYLITNVLKREWRRQNSLPLTTNFSQKLTQPSKGISYPVGDLYRRFTKLTLPCAYTLHSNPIPLTDGTKGLLHTFHKEVTNFSQHVFVILLLGILMSPLSTEQLPGPPPPPIPPHSPPPQHTPFPPPPQPTPVHTHLSKSPIHFKILNAPVKHYVEYTCIREHVSTSKVPPDLPEVKAQGILT